MAAISTAETAEDLQSHVDDSKQNDTRKKNNHNRADCSHFNLSVYGTF
jgi:hypothetical protein